VFRGISISPPGGKQIQISLNNLMEHVKEDEKQALENLQFLSFEDGIQRRGQMIREASIKSGGGRVKSPG